MNIQKNNQKNIKYKKNIYSKTKKQLRKIKII